MVPMDFGYGLGVLFEYGTSFGLRPFADINMYRAQKQVARVGEYSSSEWVRAGAGSLADLAGQEYELV